MSTSEPVTMPHPDHPDDELLAALAAAEPDAAANPSLAAHVAGCERCTSVLADLRTVRAALAELPDVRPSRPLRFLPAVPDAAPSAPRPGWVDLLRRVSSPAMALAVVLIVVGALGTAMGSAPQAASTALDKGAGAAAAQPLGSSGRQEASAPAQDRSGSALTPGAGATATPSMTPVFGGPVSPSAVASERLQSMASSGPRAANSAPSGKPPFEAVLGVGIVLLAAAFLARAAVRRRDPPGTL